MEKRGREKEWGKEGVGGKENNSTSGNGMSMEDIFSHCGDIFGGGFG